MKRIVVTIRLLWTVRMFTWWWSVDRCSWVSFRLNKEGIWQWMWHFLLIIIASIVHKYWIKGIPRGYTIWSGRHPSGSQRPGSARRLLTSLGMSAWPYRVTAQYSYFSPIRFIDYNTHNTVPLCSPFPATNGRGFSCRHHSRLWGLSQDKSP